MKRRIVQLMMLLFAMPGSAFAIGLTPNATRMDIIKYSAIFFIGCAVMFFPFDPAHYYPVSGSQLLLAGRCHEHRSFALYSLRAKSFYASFFRALRIRRMARSFFVYGRNLDNSSAAQSVARPTPRGLKRITRRENGQSTTPTE